MFRMRIKRSFEIYPVLFKGISIGWVNCYIKNIPSLRFLPTVSTSIVDTWLIQDDKNLYQSLKKFFQ